MWLLLLPALAGAQSAQHWVKVAEKSLNQGDFYGAAHYFQMACESDTGNLKVHYQYAEALRLNQDYKKAEVAYNKVWQKDRGQQFPETEYWLALMQKQNGRYQEAGAHFKSFKRNFRDRQAYVYTASKQEIKACAFAQRLPPDNGKLDFEHPGEPLNSYDSEFAPFLWNDSTLVFSALRYNKVNADNSLPLDSTYFVRLYKAQRSGEAWASAVLFEEALNLEGMNVANFTASEDGKRVYFSVCEEKQPCQIYTAAWLGDQWGEATPMEAPINLEGFSSTQPHLTTIEGKATLFFVSDRPKGKGKLDIWLTQVDRKGRFSKVKNAGSKVNTKGNEITPFYRNDEGRLYFSSDWHLGLGGFDVLWSEGQRSFKPATNAGKAINTPAHDYYYSYFPAAEMGFLTSNRSGGLMKSGTCCNDIYQWRYQRPEEPDTLTEEEALQMTFAELNSYLPLTLYFHNDEPNPRSRDTTTTLSYLATLNDYLKLQPTYESEYASGLKKNEARQAKDDMGAFFEEDIAQGGKDLAFFTGLLLTELEKGRQIQLALKGYASPLAQSDYNLILTQRRIASLVNYLREYQNGILVPYLDGKAANGGRLELYRIPFGENRSDLAVSDNLNDKKNSVYSRKAALERKIEILEVKQYTGDDRPDALEFHRDEVDLGTVKQGEKVTFTYQFTNTSTETVALRAFKPQCNCTTAETSQGEIAPGETATITVEFDSTEKVGALQRSIEVLWEAPPQSKTLTFKVIVAE